MAFDVSILCLIGCAFAMFFVSLVHDLVTSLRRARARQRLELALSAEGVPCPQRPLAPARRETFPESIHTAVA